MNIIISIIIIMIVKNTNSFIKNYKQYNISYIIITVAILRIKLVIYNPRKCIYKTAVSSNKIGQIINVY